MPHHFLLAPEPQAALSQLAVLSWQWATQLGLTVLDIGRIGGAGYLPGLVVYGSEGRLWAMISGGFEGDGLYCGTGVQDFVLFGEGDSVLYSQWVLIVVAIWVLLLFPVHFGILRLICICFVDILRKDGLDRVGADLMQGLLNVHIVDLYQLLLFALILLHFLQFRYAGYIASLVLKLRQ